MDAATKIDAGKTMAEMWDGFAEAALPMCAPDSAQYKWMKVAFFSGGLCLFNWFMVQMDEGEEPTQSDLDRSDALFKEITDFIASQGHVRNLQ